MKWRRLAWLVMLVLVVAIVWAATDLKRAYEKLDSARSDDAGDAELRLTSLQKQIDSHRAHLAGLEKLTLWRQGVDFMSWVTRQAYDTNVQVIGVEHLPVEHESEYRNTTVNVTIRGDYNRLGRFINRLERSPSAIRINSLRIRRKEHTPEDVVMVLSMSYFQKGDTS